MPDISIQNTDANMLNRWLTDVHYLHRPVIRSKLLGYGLWVDGVLCGGILWATTPFTKKKGIIGPGQPYDKWECLVLARMYLSPDAPINVTQFLAEAIGRPGRRNRRRRGWRLQRDWVKAHPPRFPTNPFVPRLLISWSDTGLETIESCPKCNTRHIGNHRGVIYQAAGWEKYDDSFSTGRRAGNKDLNFSVQRDNTMPKTCWLLKLSANAKVRELGKAIHITKGK